MGNSDVVIKDNTSKDSDPELPQQGVVHVDVRKEFINKHEFILNEHISQWACMEATKLGFHIVIERPDSSSDRRQTFVTLRCEGSNLYKKPIWKLKHDDTGTRKCECPFKVCEYHK